MLPDSFNIAGSDMSGYKSVDVEMRTRNKRFPGHTLFKISEFSLRNGKLYFRWSLKQLYINCCRNEYSAEVILYPTRSKCVRWECIGNDLLEYQISMRRRSHIELVHLALVLIWEEEGCALWINWWICVACSDIDWCSTDTSWYPDDVWVRDRSDDISDGWIDGREEGWEYEEIMRGCW